MLLKLFNLSICFYTRMTTSDFKMNYWCKSIWSILWDEWLDYLNFRILLFEVYGRLTKYDNCFHLNPSMKLFLGILEDYIPSPRGQTLILLEFSDFLWLQFHVPLGIWVDLVVVKVTRHHYKETRSPFRTLARNLAVVRTFSTSRCPFRIDFDLEDSLHGKLLGAYRATLL